MEYSNENKGAIWKNEKKESDNHPDFTGSLNVEGIEYWVSAWKKGKDANPKAPVLKFSIKPKEAPKAQKGTHSSADFIDADFDDELDF